MSLANYFADLHIHIGRDMHNKPVKITGARNLTLTNILIEASRHKGMDMIGVIDCHVPNVQREIIQLLEDGRAVELEDGGIRFENVTLILGSEIEIYDEFCQGPIHILTFLPNIKAMVEFSNFLSRKMKNINLSSQRYYGTGRDVQKQIKALNGIFIPAHVFTPFKSLYGRGVVKSLAEVFDPSMIDGIELGLSSDTAMADKIDELHAYEFVTSSDAHSLAKIAREYQQLMLNSPSFIELRKALQRKDDRKIVKNFGMNPLLGKYSGTVCYQCREKMDLKADKCQSCGSHKKIIGVGERIRELSSSNNEVRNRPEYVYQVPLEYLPQLGPKTLQKLLDHFGTEMNVIHHVSYNQLQEVVGDALAKLITDMRVGKLRIEAGGGGIYGRIKP